MVCLRLLQKVHLSMKLLTNLLSQVLDMLISPSFACLQWHMTHAVCCTIQAPLKAEAPLLLDIFHNIYQAVDVQELLKAGTAADSISGAGSHAAGTGGCCPVPLLTVETVGFFAWPLQRFSSTANTAVHVCPGDDC